MCREEIEQSGGWHTLKFVRTFLTSAFDLRVAHPLRHAKGGAFDSSLRAFSFRARALISRMKLMVTI
jgi:hypothetical protein